MENTSHNAMHQYRHEADEYRRIELITGVARRRRWSAVEKAAVVAESLQPEINVSMVARRHGVSRGPLQTWRRTALRQDADGAQVFVRSLRQNRLSPHQEILPLRSTYSD
jgi:transposase